MNIFKLIQEIKYKKTRREIQSMIDVLEAAKTIGVIQEANLFNKKIMKTFIEQMNMSSIRENSKNGKMISQFIEQHKPWQDFVNGENMLKDLYDALKDTTYKHKLYENDSPTLFFYRIFNDTIERANNKFLTRNYTEEEQSFIENKNSLNNPEQVYRGGGKKAPRKTAPKKAEKAPRKTAPKKAEKAPRKTAPKKA